MQKCIIISIRPEWVEKILNGEKTIEIRKSMPKCDYPIDVYIYCTRTKPYLMVGRNDNKTYLDNGGKESVYSPPHNYIGNGKIVAKFTLNEVVDILPYKKQKGNKTYITYLSFCEDVNWGNKTCLTQLDFENYLGLKKGYGWHIDNLEIFDKPMELSDFKTQCKDYYNGWSGCDYSCGYAENKQCFGGKIALKKAPQSWCYAWRQTND